MRDSDLQPQCATAGATPGPSRRSLLSNFFQSIGMVRLLPLILMIGYSGAHAQSRSYPREIRGYKVERRVIQLRKPNKQTKPMVAAGERPRQVGKPENEPSTASNSSTVPDPTSEADVDELITFGTPRLAKVTPLGISLEIPIVVAAVQQKGHVEFLVFEDMVFNNTPVEISEYHREFDLPNRDPLTLGEPLSFYIYLPRAVLAGIDEWTNSKETWPVSGRVYVFGKFKKGWFSFKRCIPVELKLTMRNPFKSREH